jgi:hypothetical protein
MFLLHVIFILYCFLQIYTVDVHLTVLVLIGNSRLSIIYTTDLYERCGCMYKNHLSNFYVPLSIRMMPVLVFYV